MWIDSVRPKSSIRRRLEAQMRSACVTKIGTYVFTHYHSRSDVYLRRLLSELSVGEVVLPMPQNEDERGLCMSMAQIALDAGCVPRLLEDSIMIGSVGLRGRGAVSSPEVPRACLHFRYRSVMRMLHISAPDSLIQTRSSEHSPALCSRKISS